MSHRTSFPAVPDEAEAGGRSRRKRLALGGLGALLVAAALGFAAFGSGPPDGGGSRVKAIAAPEPFDSRSAERVARRIRAAQADVTAVWRHDFRRRFGRAYAPPEVIHFTGRRPSRCAGAGGISGLGYCALDRTVSLDLAFLSGLAATLGAEGERAVALLVARVGAEHVQAELAIAGDADRARRGLPPEAAAALDRELALQGDCLTGVWARRAKKHMGEIETGTWGRVVETVRAAHAEAAEAVKLASGEPEAREEAFGRGYAEGEVRDCLAPGLEGVLG